jgi:hypothetical protein
MSSIVLTLFLLTVLASPAFAKGPPVDETIYYTGTRLNPCTGLDHEIDATIRLQIHEFENKNKTHLNIQYRWDITTDDGYSGKVVGPDVINISDGHETITIIANGTLKNDSGQTIKRTNDCFMFHPSWSRTRPDKEVARDRLDVGWARPTYRAIEDWRSAAFRCFRDHQSLELSFFRSPDRRYRHIITIGKVGC